MDDMDGLNRWREEILPPLKTVAEHQISQQAELLR